MSNSKAATEQVEELKMRLALAAADSMGGVAFAALAVDELEQAIAATLGSGTLTAEQVMVIAGKHQPDYCSDTHVCFDWQAIADELNAELGSGTCECVKGKCSNCGKDLPEDPYSDYEGNFCPSCGARIRKAVKR